MIFHRKFNLLDACITQQLLDFLFQRAFKQIRLAAKSAFTLTSTIN